MQADPRQLELLGKSPVPLIPYYLFKSCTKEFNKYDSCLKKNDNPSKCREEDKKSSNCFSGYMRNVMADCVNTVDRSTTDESGKFKEDFLNNFDSCLNRVSDKDNGSPSYTELVAPLEDLPTDSTSLQLSCSALGFLFSRRSCIKTFENYRKCRKSSDVFGCSDQGRDLALCTMNYSGSVVERCIENVGNFYTAQSGIDKSAPEPTNLEILSQFYKCLSST